jgi:Uma2 family endonuclease
LAASALTWAARVELTAPAGLVTIEAVINAGVSLRGRFMSLGTTSPPVADIVYPESDGLPLAENAIQLRWIFVLYANLQALFRNQADVFVAADLFWYPLEGHPEIRVAPDVLVVFGRPKGDRGSYQEWKEGNIPLTVVMEVLSPSNTVMEMEDKLDFYEEHGVEEYYVYDPQSNQLVVYLRQGDRLNRVGRKQEYTSPRLGIRFDLSGEEMVVYGPNGERFLTFDELSDLRAQAEERAEHTKELVARLAALSRKARQGLASETELRELEELESETLGQ